MSQDWEQAQGPETVAQQLLNDAANDDNKNDLTLRRVPRAAIKKPRVIVLFGAPGSGKTTQGKLLARSRANSVHFSTGDFFRTQVREGTELGREVGKFLDRDMFVPDALVLRVLTEFIAANPQKLIILDGVPRTRVQAELLNNMCNVTRFVYLYVTQAECEARIMQRTSEVKDRDDQDQEKTQRRMQTFYTTCGPIMDVFCTKLGVAVGDCDIDETFQNVQNALDQLTNIEPNFCACKLRLAKQLALPCGHCTQCAACVQNNRNCSTCHADVDAYLVLGNDNTHDVKMDGGFSITSSLVETSRRKEQQTSNRAKVCFTVHVPQLETRQGQHIVAVVDVSGSMNTRAQQEDETGNLVDLDYSLLDAIKYSLKAMVKCMIDTDRFSLVVFSSFAHTLVECAPMTSANTSRVIELIDAMRATGTTNIWAGLEHGLEIIQRNAPMRVTIALLTDGIPDQGCDGVDELRKWQKMENRAPFELVTFGYGSKLKLNVLFELAELGHGNYIWIPSSSETGSIFVKFMANASAICTQNAILNIQTANKCMIAADPHGFASKDVQRTPHACSVNIGSLRSGTTTEVVLDMLLVADSYANVALSVGKQVVASLTANNRNVSGDAGAAHARLMMCHQLRKAILDSVDTLYHVDEAICALQKMAATHPIVAFYLKDLKGEEIQLEDGSVVVEGGKIAKGATNAKYALWGCHLIPSYLTTHQRKLCTNMYEVGCMPYNTPWTTAFTSMGKRFYEDFAPTVPVAQAPKPTVTYHYTAQSTPLSSTSGFSSGGSGSCLAGDCIATVRTNDGKLVPTRIDQLRVGDRVCGEGTYSAIKYVLQKKSATPLYNIPGCGLRISERHPFREAGKPNTAWRRAELEFPQPTSTEDIVYNFVLWSDHVMIVNGMACLCLGHDLDDPLLQHPLYASSTAMERACQTLTADTNGTFVIHALKRDQTGRVCGFLQN